MTFQPSNSFAPFLPTSIYLPDDFDQMLLRLQAYLTEVSLKVNDREIGLYEQTELVTGQTWFPLAGQLISQQTFRQVFVFGTINAGATLNIPHNITNLLQFTKIYGTCITATPDNRPIPYADAALVTNQISINATAANIVIVNGATAPNISSGLAIIEYLKN